MASLVEAALAKGHLKDFAADVVSLVREQQKGHREGRAEVIMLGPKALQREFDGFPKSSSEWASIASAKTHRAAAPAAAAWSRLPEDMGEQPQQGASSYNVEEDEEERRGRMATRIQAAWRRWWEAESRRRAIKSLRLWMR